MSASQRLDARMIFLVESLVIAFELLGTEHELRDEAGAVYVKFPADAEASRATQGDPRAKKEAYARVFDDPLPPMTPGGAESTTSVRGVPREDIASVGCLRVRVEATVSPPPFPAAGAAGDYDRASQLLHDAITRGRAVVEELVEHTRTTSVRTGWGRGTRR